SPISVSIAMASAPSLSNPALRAFQKASRQCSHRTVTITCRTARILESGPVSFKPTPAKIKLAIHHPVSDVEVISYFSNLPLLFVYPMQWKHDFSLFFRFEPLFGMVSTKNTIRRQ